MGIGIVVRSVWMLVLLLGVYCIVVRSVLTVEIMIQYCVNLSFTFNEDR